MNEINRAKQDLYISAEKRVTIAQVAWENSIAVGGSRSYSKRTK